MENTLTLPEMTAPEARDCIKSIKSNLINTRSLVLDLYDRKGWKALGYENWRECVTKEFNQSEAYLYRQLEAAQAEKNISPIGEKAIPKQIPESHLRPLTHLPPEQQQKAWKKAVETAPEGKVTAKHVEKTVNEMKGTKEGKKEDILTPGDSENLYRLKSLWSKINGADKKTFIRWLKSRREL